MNTKAVIVALTLVVLNVSAFLLPTQPKQIPKFAPYIGNNHTEVDLVALHHKYGMDWVTLGLVSSIDGQCHPSWGGSTPIDDKQFVSRVNAFKNAGGQVVVSSGGSEVNYLEINCTSSQDLSEVYKRVLDVTGSSHLDVDIEKPVDNEKIARAVAQLQKERPDVVFSFTTGSGDNGIDELGLQFLKVAVKNSVSVDLVKVFTMDRPTNDSWTVAVHKAVEGAHNQLRELFPQKTSSQIYGMIGVIPMIGQNDVGPTFSLTDARNVVSYATDKGLGQLTFWALTRDHKVCPNPSTSWRFPIDECTNIAQEDNEFTQIFARFGQSLPERVYHQIANKLNL